MNYARTYRRLLKRCGVETGDEGWTLRGDSERGGVGTGCNELYPYMSASIEAWDNEERSTTRRSGIII